MMDAYERYEAAKREFLQSNPGATALEYETACIEFARLAGV
jgi:hypothetical protein